jgi:sugar lactone lactonase YvrE
LPGPNGLQIFHDEVYVSVSDRMHVVAFRIKAHGSAGLGRVHVALGFDDFAFDVKGNLYGTTNFVFNTVVRVTPDGTSEILASFADGLDGPSAAAFGVENDKKHLYITNRRFRTSQVKPPAGQASCGWMSGSRASRGPKVLPMY